MSHSTGEQFPRDPLAAGPRGTSGIGTDAGTSAGTSSTKDVAKDQAAQVGQEAKESGQHVAGVARDQAAGVAAEAGQQAKDLLHRSRGEVSSQLSSQQQRAAGGLRSLGDELRDLAEGKGASSGVVSDLAHQASQRVSTVASWLEDREPSDLLQDVQAFARRRPGAFLAAAAGIGVLAGRLTRGIAANSHQGGTSTARSSAPTGSPTGAAQGTYRVGTPGPVETTYPASAGHDAGYGTGQQTGQQAGTVYPTGTTSYGTDPVSTTEAFGEPGGRVLP